MYTFISILVCLASLYYLGNMANTYNYDTTYVAPVVTMFIYSMLSIVREAKRKLDSWDDYGHNDDYEYNAYAGKTTYRHYSPSKTKKEEVNPNYHSCTNYKGEKVEVFASKPIKEKSYNKELTTSVHYVSNASVRDSLKELEKSRWFRFKRSFCGVFGFDITEKYYKQNRKAIRKVTVKRYPSCDNDYTQYSPKYIEAKVYNDVAKSVTRCCEIIIDGEFKTNINDASN